MDPSDPPLLSKAFQMRRGRNRVDRRLTPPFSRRIQFLEGHTLLPKGVLLLCHVRTSNRRAETALLALRLVPHWSVLLLTVKRPNSYGATSSSIGRRRNPGQARNPGTVRFSHIPLQELGLHAVLY